MRKLANASELSRGMVVRWDWVNPPSAGYRPVGRVITRDDRPTMSVAESGFGIQLLDCAMWVINPELMFEKGRPLYDTGAREVLRPDLS